MTMNPDASVLKGFLMLQKVFMKTRFMNESSAG